MKKSIIISIVLLTLFSIMVTSCFKDLDTKPKYGFNSEEVYKTSDGYKSVLAKLYAGFSTTGNDGPAGSPDFPDGADEGFSQYTRVLWKLQELPTDEAICGWTDIGIADLDVINWTSENPWVRRMYNRIYFIIALSNEFIRESSDDKLSERGFNDEEKKKIREFKAEARFLRSLAYYHQLDLFGKGPFVTEADGVGNFLPAEGSGSQLFSYIESELLDIENSLVDAKTNEYGRADRAAAWTLLAKLYLNAQVYISEPRNSECITYCSKVIAKGYSLDADYRWVFLADNKLSTEIIFPITHDGLFTQSYGGTNFLIHACIDAAMKPKDTFGVNDGWAGLRCKQTLVNLFTDSILDARCLFFKTGHSLDVDTISLFSNGYPTTKWRNRTRSGAIGSNATGTFVDTDYPMFRLADVYLMYAEATLRGGNGNPADGLNYVNLLRQRAYGAGNGTITGADLNLDFILNERARELYFESTRRTDLIRFGKFTGGSYLWPFKGGDADGTSVDSKYNLYPIPISDLNANPNLTQNPGY